MTTVVWDGPRLYSCDALATLVPHSGVWTHWPSSGGSHASASLARRFPLRRHRYDRRNDGRHDRGGEFGTGRLAGDRITSTPFRAAGATDHAGHGGRIHRSCDQPRGGRVAKRDLANDRGPRPGLPDGDLYGSHPLPGWGWKVAAARIARDD